MKTTVYLAGPIHGRTDAQAMDWRQYVASRLSSEHFVVLDPMRRDYRGNEDGNEREIVEGDLQDIQGADCLIVNAAAPTWGTAMEVFAAAKAGKWIVAFGAVGSVSPWLKHHVTVLVSTSAIAVDLLVFVASSRDVDNS